MSKFKLLSKGFKVVKKTGNMLKKLSGKVKKPGKFSKKADDIAKLTPVDQVKKVNKMKKFITKHPKISKTLGGTAIGLGAYGVGNVIDLLVSGYRPAIIEISDGGVQTYTFTKDDGTESTLETNTVIIKTSQEHTLTTEDVDNELWIQILESNSVMNLATKKPSNIGDQGTGIFPLLEVIDLYTIRLGIGEHTITENGDEGKLKIAVDFTNLMDVLPKDVAQDFDNVVNCFDSVGKTATNKIPGLIGIWGMVIAAALGAIFVILTPLSFVNLIFGLILITIVVALYFTNTFKKLCSWALVDICGTGDDEIGFPCGLFYNLDELEDFAEDEDGDEDEDEDEAVEEYCRKCSCWHR